MATPGSAPGCCVREHSVLRDFVKTVKWILIVLAVVAVGLVAGYFGTQSPQPTPAPAPTVTVAIRPSTTPNRPVRPDSTNFFLGRVRTNRVHSDSSSTNATPEWEEKIDAILTSDAEDSQKARQMTDMFLSLPEDGQVEVAQHLSNLVEDKDYASINQFLTNSALPEAALDVFLADALNRPNSLKMPVLLSVAQDPTNPKASEAKDLLELFLEEDYGSDWATWQAKVDQYLRDNPD